jgi:hypothetical protein
MVLGVQRALHLNGERAFMANQIFNLFVAIVGYMALTAVVGTCVWTISKFLIRWAKKTKLNKKVFVGLNLLTGAAGFSILVPSVNDANQVAQGFAVPSSDIALIITGVVLIAWAFCLLVCAVTNFSGIGIEY